MQGIVFLVLPDLESLKGDRLRGSRQDPLICDHCDGKDGHKGKACDACEQRMGSEDQKTPNISFSVSYFNYTVSTSEDECDNITINLNRLKIRRTSRERNENLKDKDRQT